MCLTLSSLMYIHAAYCIVQPNFRKRHVSIVTYYRNFPTFPDSCFLFCIIFIFSCVTLILFKIHLFCYIYTYMYQSKRRSWTEFPHDIQSLSQRGKYFNFSSLHSLPPSLPPPPPPLPLSPPYSDINLPLHFPRYPKKSQPCRFIRYSPFNLSAQRFQTSIRELFGSVISNQHSQILQLIPTSQIRKLLRCDSPQIANPRTFMINSQIANTQISKKILHNFVSKQS